jgi:hypothetical protein
VKELGFLEARLMEKEKIDLNQRANLAKELVQSKGYCGSIKYHNGIPESMCIKPKHDDMSHKYTDKIVQIIPF